MKTPQTPQNGQQGYQHSNHRSHDNRRDTLKHQYAQHDEKLTDDSNFKEGKPKDDSMDFRDTLDNLEAEK